MPIVQLRPRLVADTGETKRAADARAEVTIGKASSPCNGEAISWQPPRHLKCCRPRLQLGKITLAAQFVSRPSNGPAQQLRDTRRLRGLRPEEMARFSAIAK